MSDVLFTGDDNDFSPTDKISDPNRSSLMVAQQVRRGVQVGRGEWLRNASEGIDWLGYFTAKRISLARLEADIRSVMNEIPQIDDIQSVTATKVGRNVTINAKGTISGARFVATLLAAKENQRIGDDAIYSVVFAFFGVDEIV